MSNFRNNEGSRRDDDALGRPAAKRVRVVDPNGLQDDSVLPRQKTIPETRVFDGVPAIQFALGANGGKPSAGLIETLTSLRNQFSLRHSELQALITSSQSTSSEDGKTPSSGSYYNALPTILQTTDPRLLILEKWCTSSPGLEELFLVWDSASMPSGWPKSGAQSQQGPAAMSSSIASLSLNILSSILSLLSSYYTFHPHAYLIVNKLFSNERWRRLCGYITGGSTSNELILVTLRLLSVVVERWDAKKVFEGFVWEAKSLSKLLQMRRKSSSSSQTNPLVKPDIRTAYTLFLLSFLLPSATSSSNSQTKTAFLQQHSFHFTSIFKNLHQDHPALIRRVLEVSWEGIWCDIRVSRSLKVGVFASGGILQSLLKLYERNTPEGAEGENDIEGYTVADLVHHFLLAICTRPGVGLCFKDRGWYPRDVGGDSLFNEDVDDEDNSKTSSKTYKPKVNLHNPTLLNLLKSLKPTDDPRQNELALKVLSSTPELVSLYLPASGLTLDPPRLSSKWLANIGFFASVIGGGSVPEGTWVLGGEKEEGEKVYRPGPPPLTTIVNNVVPGGGVTRLNMRNVFTKGLQFAVVAGNSKTTAKTSDTGNLVQHTTALALIRCLDKLGRVRQAMESVAKALGEGESSGVGRWQDVGQEGGEEEVGYERIREGLWTKRTKEVVKEVRKRLPEFQVVVAFCTAHLKTSSSSPANATVSPADTENVSEGDQIKKAILAECAMRLLWMYQEALPEVVEEARFDVGKVLVGFEVRGDADNVGEGEENTDEDDGEGEEGDQPKQEQRLSTSSRLQHLTQLHILRFLRASPAFSFTAPSPSYPGHTHLYSLLVALVKLGSASEGDGRDHGLYAELRGLLRQVLGKSIVFQWGGDGGKEGETEEEVDVWLASLPLGLRRVREVKRLVDVTEDGDEKMNDEEGEGATMVTVYPETVDGTRLTDERLSVVNFLEDCILRCIKTPYRYIEDLEKLAAQSNDEGPAEQDASANGSLPAPLIVTLLEQLEAKLVSQAASTPSAAPLLLSPSDVLAIAAYIRTLVFALIGKLEPESSLSDANHQPVVLQRVLDRFEDRVLVLWDNAFGGEPHALVRNAVKREVRIARRCLGCTVGGETNDEDEDKDVDDFLDLIEALEISSSDEHRLTVYELIDWVRLLEAPLNQVQVTRLWSSVKGISADGLGEVVKYLDVPDIRDAEKGVSVWEVLLSTEPTVTLGGSDEAMETGEEDEDEEGEDYHEHEDGSDSDEESVAPFDPRSLPFEYLLVHALPRHLSDLDCQEILVGSAFNHCTSSSTATAHKVQYVVRHLLQRFSQFLAIDQADAASALLSVLSTLLKKVKVLNQAAFDAAKGLVVAGLKELMVLSPTKASSTGVLKGNSIEVVREGLLRVQEVALDPREARDRALVGEIAGVWVDTLRENMAAGGEAGGENESMEYSGWWIRFVQPEEILDLLGEVVQIELQQNVKAKKVAIVDEIMGWCLTALGDALRHGEWLYGRPTERPRDPNLLFQLHAVLSDGGKRAEGVRIVEELIAGMLEVDGILLGLGGEFSLIQDQSVAKVVEVAVKRWSGLRVSRAASTDESDILRSARSFLSRPLEEWSDATDKIMRNFLYRQKRSEGRDIALQQEVVEWLAKGEGVESEGGERIVGLAHALLDCTLHRGYATNLGGEEVVVKLFKLLLHHVMTPGQRRLQAKDSLRMLVEILSSLKDEGRILQSCFAQMELQLKTLKKLVISSKSSSLTPEIISFSCDSIVYFTANSSSNLERVQSIGDHVLEVGMQWLIRQLGDEDGKRELDDETSAVCKELAELVKIAGVSCKAGTLETLLGVVVQSQYHLAHPECLELVGLGLKKADLKPLVVNRYLQGILQHPHFFKLCVAPSSSSSAPVAPSNPLERIRDSIISLLKTLFFLHPANTCQVSHIEPLIRIYGATLAISDIRILAIFKLFERQRKLSLRSIVGRWAPPSSSLANAVGSGEGVGLEALQNLDPILALRTALSFPTWKGLDDDDDNDDQRGRKASTRAKSSGYESQFYDPVFLLFLLQHVLANGPPASAIAWIEIFRSNVVGLALRALSAKDERVRDLGMGCVVGVWTLMQNADLQEREHVLYLLALLKNALPPPVPSSGSMRMEIDGDDKRDDKHPPRLPSYTTLLLFHALRGIFNPSTFVYPLTSRFLLQRPELDITDVPMLYNMLYSSDTDDWKKERGWIVRFLADGALTGSGVGDWRLLKRRHVWDLVASMYQSAGAGSAAATFGASDGGVGAGGDRALKTGILDFLVNLTRHRGPTMSLVLKSGLLAWIEVQLIGPDRHAGYGAEWLRILENILVVVDEKKMEASALRGTWVKVVARCIQGILKEATGSPLSLTNVLPLAVRLIVRLSLVDSIAASSLVAVLQQAFEGLEIFEANVKHRPTSSLEGQVPEFDDLVPPAQHSSHRLHEKLVFEEEPLFFVWGRSVEMLWRATMNLDLSNSASPLRDMWNGLTSRLLVWRGLVGSDASPVGEWVRVECIKNMGHDSSLGYQK